MPVSEICGLNPIVPDLFPASRMGCGQPIHTCREVYRCTECRTPFHRECAERHFGLHAGAAPGRAPAPEPTEEKFYSLHMTLLNTEQALRQQAAWIRDVLQKAFPEAGPAAWSLAEVASIGRPDPEEESPDV